MPPRKQSSPVPPGMPIMEYLASQMANGALVRGEFPVRPKSEEDLAIERDAATTEDLREKCRQGNPFPLVAWQWPELVLSNELEIRIFRENLRLVEPTPIDDRIKEAILDQNNPPLRIDWWQAIILAATFHPAIGEIFLAGAVGIGKGFSSAVSANLWYDVYDESRIHLTGRDRDHARKNIFGEFWTWRSKMAHPGVGSLTSEALTDTKRHYAVLLNPDVSSPTAGEAFSGAHGKRTLYQFDECSALPSVFIKNAARNARSIFALTNPRHPIGWFYDAFRDLGERRIAVTPGHLRMRLCMSIGGLDCLNVRWKRLKAPVAPKGGIELDEHLHPVE